MGLPPPPQICFRETLYLLRNGSSGDIPSHTAGEPGGWRTVTWTWMQADAGFELAATVFSSVPAALRAEVASLSTLAGHTSDARIIAAANLGSRDAHEKSSGAAFTGASLNLGPRSPAHFAFLCDVNGEPRYTRRAATRDLWLTAGGLQHQPHYRSFQSKAEARAYFWGAELPCPDEH